MPAKRAANWLSLERPEIFACTLKRSGDDYDGFWGQEKGKKNKTPAYPSVPKKTASNTLRLLQPSILPQRGSPVAIAEEV